MRTQYTTVVPRTDRMNIVVISPASLCTPPCEDGYGGIERQAWLICEGLVRLGHRVTLIAKEGSKRPLRGELITYDGDEDLLNAVDKARTFTTAIDCWIDETHNKILSILMPNLPQITRYEVMSLMGNPKCPVLISGGQRDAKFDGKDWPIIYQSVNLDELPFYEGPRRDYLLYMGQKITEKRIDWACEAAAKTGTPLYIHGPGWGQPECHNLIRGYTMLYPELIHNEVEIGGAEKINKLQHAKALIHLPGALNWCEAGGIVVLEALAVGTPCIVSDNGCLPEYIQDGVNGFVVKSIGEAADAIRKIDRIDPSNCTRSVEKYHYIHQAAQYDDLCRRAARGETWR
jgi:glycosyltransferase involved in cell wall biosynthesis